MRPHTFLRTQIRNILRKWQQDRGSVVFHSLPERPRLRRLLENKNDKASCRRRIGEALLRAEKFGDLITADHKVHNEGCESRDNQWYAVLVQDLDTQWIQSFPCKTKSSQETKKLVQILRTVASTESCLYRQLDGIWESM